MLLLLFLLFGCLMLLFLPLWQFAWQKELPHGTCSLT